MNSMQLLGKAQFHGAKRLAFSKYRFYWALALTVLLLCSLSVLTVGITRFFENPTYVAQSDAKQTLKPFPTVAVCPEVQFPRYKINAFVNNLKYPPGINASIITEVLPQLGAFFSPDVTYNIKDLQKIQHVLDYNDLSLETAGRMLTLSCEETILRCRWLNRFLNCSTAFTMELTNYGYCCIFNGLSLRREIKTYGIHRMRQKEKLLVKSVGFSNALVMAVNQSHAWFGNLDLSYKWLALQGAQYTDVVYNGTPISPSVETWAAYDSKMLQVTYEAQSLGDELRQCRLTSEQLKYFPHYHEHYCLLECEMERIKNQCNCVLVVHPYQSGVPVCNYKQIKCARQIAVSFGGKDNCHCPPSCDTENEKVTVSTNELTYTKVYDDFYYDLDFNNISIIRVYILQHNRRIFTRTSFFTTLDLFSQLGGVFSVFFGCSVLSMLEIMQLTWKFIHEFYYQKKKLRTKLKLTKNVNAPLKYKI